MVLSLCVASSRVGTKAPAILKDLKGRRKFAETSGLSRFPPDAIVCRISVSARCPPQRHKRRLYGCVLRRQS